MEIMYARVHYLYYGRDGSIGNFGNYGNHGSKGEKLGGGTERRTAVGEVPAAVAYGVCVVWIISRELWWLCCPERG